VPPMPTEENGAASPTNSNRNPVVSAIPGRGTPASANNKAMQPRRQII
jgi:hypothetical protein